MALSKEQLSEAIKQYGNKFNASKALGIPKSVFYEWCDKYGLDKYGDSYLKDMSQEEVLEYSQRLARKNQKIADINRIERKVWRENTRYTNAIEEFSAQILETVQNLPKPKFPDIKTNNQENFGVIQFADLHLNELIDVPGNKYDWDIASKRVRKHILESTKIFKAYGVKEVLLINTGDTLNNDILLDKILNNAYNRACAVTLAFDILRSAVIELSRSFKVSVVFNDANETRLYKDIGFAENVASNNFDRTLYMMLKGYFYNTPVQFVGCGLEVLVNFKGVNILSLHGHTLKMGNYENEINKLVSKYASTQQKVDFVLSGHIHSTCITPNGMRSGSTAGGNAYSFYGLNLPSRASQNCAVFKSNGDKIAIAIDLQDVSGIEGYQYNKTLESYNSVAEDKNHKSVEIVKVVI